MRFCPESVERSTMSGIMPPITSCIKLGCKFHALVSGSTVGLCCPSNTARFFASEVEFLISSPAGPSLSLSRIRASISFSLCVMVFTRRPLYLDFAARLSNPVLYRKLFSLKENFSEPVHTRGFQGPRTQISGHPCLRFHHSQSSISISDREVAASHREYLD